jgi:hypothetical protein
LLGGLSSGWRILPNLDDEILFHLNEEGMIRRMSPDNFKHVYKKLSDRVPFHPITLELRSGSRLEINHPEALTLYQELFVYASSRGVRSVLEYAAVIRFIDTTGSV